MKSVISSHEDLIYRYPEISETFIEAFSGEPWNEVSKCADTRDKKGCIGGYTELQIGALCTKCCVTISEPAYTTESLTQSFTNHFKSYQSKWYTEETEDRIALAGYASKLKLAELRQTVYKSSTYAIENTISNLYGDDTSIAWLHELFANREVRPSGNLNNFGDMCNKLTDALDENTLAFCTLNKRMIHAAIRDFGSNVTILEPQEIDDYRYLVRIAM